MINLGDFPTGKTLYIPFHTFSSDDPSASITITGLALADIKVYKNGGTTQRSSTSGFALLDTDGIDFDGITGIHGISIDTSDDTDAGFYAVSSEYWVVIDNITLDGATVSFTAAVFSIDNRGLISAVGNLTSGSAAINVTPLAAPNGFVITTGLSEANDEDSTHALDGITHDLLPSGGTTDCYYVFDVGGNGVPVSVTWDGYVNANGDTWDMYAYNWGTTSWQQVGSVSGANGTTIITETFTLLNAHVGTGANLGLVHFRPYSTDGTKLSTDRITCAKAVVHQSVGYANGSVWIDTTHGTAGTESYVNGVADNPVDGIADANTISTALALHRFEITADSSLTLAATQASDILNGRGYTLALGGQVLTGAHIIGAGAVSGIATTAGDEMHFTGCEMGTCTLGATHLTGCGLQDTITLSDAVNYTLTRCYSQVPGSGTPVIDFGAAIGNTGLNMRAYSGGIEVQNMGQTGADTMSLEGDGQLIINANCTGGAISIRGHFTITDNSGGAVTVTSDDVVANVAAILVDTNELQTDWADGGRLDLLLDAIPTTAMRGTDGANTTVPDAAGTAPTAVEIRAEVDSNSTQLAAIKATTDNLPSAVKKNTALANFEFFMRDTADHVTGKTGLTITAERSIDGAAFAACANSASEVSAGVYKISLAAGDLNGDTVTLKFTGTDADATIITILTKP